MAEGSAPDDHRLRRYADRICGRAGPLAPRVAEALHRVDRADFVRGFFRRDEQGWSWVAADPAPPGPVADALHGDEPLVTALSPSGMPTSSSSQPSLVAEMLDRLRLDEGMRVLEIGTGTGYNAALLSSVVGESGRVTTLDVVAAFVDAARPRIRASTARPGFGRVEAVCGDGGRGWPAGAPYDRVVATAGCAAVPDAWWDQLADDGLVLVPLAHGWTFPLVAVRKGPTRGAWRGGYAGHANFMDAVGDALRRPTAFHPVAVPPDRPVTREDLPGSAADLTFFLCLEVFGPRLVVLRGGGLPNAVAGPGVAAADGATLVCGRRLYSAGDPAGLAAVRAAVESWVALGHPRLDRYRLHLGPGATRPPDTLRAWTVPRGSTEQAVHLLSDGR